MTNDDQVDGVRPIVDVTLASAFRHAMERDGWQITTGETSALPSGQRHVAEAAKSFCRTAACGATPDEAIIALRRKLYT